MAFEIRKAERKKAKIKMGIAGVSGSGKTYSALLLARGLVDDWSKIAVIDTENGSAELYSHLGPYNVVPFAPPFEPRRYVEAIVACVKNNIEVVIIDSASHEWEACLKMNADLGGKFADWKKVNPHHQAFINAVLQSPCHIICCMRKKQDYAVTAAADGVKGKVEKVGLKEIQREGFEYELTLNLELDISHIATTSKDRTGIFMPRGPFTITEETGRDILGWANSGAEPIAPEKEMPPRPTSSPPTQNVNTAAYRIPATVDDFATGFTLEELGVSEVKKIYDRYQVKYKAGEHLSKEALDFGALAKKFLGLDTKAPQPTTPKGAIP